ncbi:glycosyltransferase involved in cell wall biosynthesis [Marinobacter sp. 3-2]|jgi:glycosyltransferase involved in cell wall biosynthesis|uniref:glycosyltransferase family 2 protein n=1 Tax=Marinobacter sp. 3-2 TaxID=2485141 RepID=UPI000D368AE4|nr:glycosyltransferase family A protein [Marinobacter sp. 3-2]ROQ42890.1 glycosyltransferase involved in cell wall biosynthesis [Marinobacter sp. 3-2]
MDAPKVSVIIPAFNAATTIGRALKSVMSQTYRNFEIVVVNDGSTDDLVAALKPFPVRLLNQANAGAASARNHGSRVATGDLIAFLDADDFWHPEKLKKQIQAFRQNPEVRYCVTDSLQVSSENWSDLVLRENGSECPNCELIDFPSVFANPYFGTPGVLIPRRIFQSVGGFNENLTTAEDVDLWLRAAYGGTVARVPEVLFYVVRSRGSLSGRFVDRTYEDNIRVIQEFCELRPEFLQRHRDTVNVANARVYCDWGSEALSRRDRVLAREKLALSIKAKPTLRSLYLFSKALLPG